MNRAQRGLDKVQSRPRDVVRWSQALQNDPTATPEEQVTAAWALGRAYAELDQIEQACTSFAESIDLATEHGLDHLTADIRLSLSGTLVAAGRITEAVQELDRAEPHVQGQATQGRYAMQRGFVAMHVGDLDESLVHYNSALAHLARGVDEQARARSLMNRGIANTMTGSMSAGQTDFLQAQELAESLGLQMLAAGAAQNLGFYAGRAGDIQMALRWFARARSLYEELGSPGRVMSLLESDFATVLLTGGLYAESAAASNRSAAMADQTGNRLAQAEALLLLARAELAAGKHAAAEEAAVQAATMFRQSDREPWGALAEYVGLQAAAQDTDPSGDLLARAVGIADRLGQAGWWREAIEAQTLAGRLAVSLGRLDEARLHLASVASRTEGGSAAMRVTTLLATATLHLADHNREEAKAALDRAMEVVEDHRATLGSTELRAHASLNGAEIARLGLRLASEDGLPSEVFHWAERWRAGGLAVIGIRADPDTRLSGALDELRAASRATIEGTTDPFDVDSDRRVAKLEQEIRQLSRESGPTGHRPQPVSLEQVQACLGDRLLIEYFVAGGRLNALAAGATDASLHDLGDLSEIENQVDLLTASLSRAAHRNPSDSSGRLAEAIAATAAGLDQRLLAGINTTGRSGVIVVPTGPLQMMPWATLPSLATSAVTVSPSSRLWARPGGERDRAIQRRGSEPEPAEVSALLVAGPRLPGGTLEVERLEALYTDAIVLSGRQATVAAVVDALGRVDIAHIAAHGSLRADNPMLSGLLLVDGPLTVYDLEALRAAPETVVLPACNAARSSVYDGDELLGTAAALLQVGVRGVVAPVTVVPDATVVPDLMVELHRALLSGQPPSVALVSARQACASEVEVGRSLAPLSFIAIDSRRVGSTA